MTSVWEAADRYLAGLAEWEPRAAQALGRTEVPATDLSPEAYEARAALAANATAELAVAVPGRPGDRMLGAALADRLAAETDLYESGFTTRLLAPLATPVHLVRSAFDNLPRDTEADWATVADRLAAVRSELAAYRETLRRSAARGQRVARRQVLVVADQCAAWIDPARDDFYRRLVTGYAGPSAARLARGAADASAATAEFAAFLRDELAPGAPERDGVGREMYGITARSFLGATLDLDDVYAYGWAELRRLADEMTVVAGRIVPGGTVAEAMAALDADPARRLSGVTELTDWLTRRVAAVTDALDGPHFTIPAQTRRVECRIAPATSGVMYYTPPDPGLTRPGRVWWCLPPGVDTATTWREVSTLHHESLPGHHLQHAITMTLPHLHPWQRTLCEVHGYAEGWAHYAEGLAGELGLLADDGERLGLLCGQIWRACRIVIDAGLHLDLPIPPGNGFTDATRWTPELGVEFLTRIAGMDAATARFEVDRYLGWPGQALAFSVGARLWREARAAAERAEGAGFDPARFHARALSLGPAGLDPLRTALEGNHG
ncbi:DUF885 domain-containing protein [Actinocatenispora rupis]|uniref:DUF885 domain-containing protein n=1 Tax=Actinocatenispora rupis TaxID=519421 RepID=A0A8J3NG37_9ACTN|nr:DUF885 domain-containing protein [Actinocatenispora rupis]GID15545.1 hypothetical protein Aru02nite_64340 [Actinocatenispora rupis]